MKNLIKINLLLTAVAILTVCTATISYLPHPETCKKFIVKIDIGEDGSGGAHYEILECPANLCFIPETACCDFPDKCKTCNPQIP